MNEISDFSMKRRNKNEHPVETEKLKMPNLIKLQLPIKTSQERNYLMSSLITRVFFRMRLFSLPLIVALFSSLSFSQIPNAGFETWETDLDTNYNPAGWQTTNSFPLVNVEQYSPGCQGNYAMKVKTLNPGFPLPGVALLQVAYNFSQIPTRFSVCLKSNIMPGDRAYIIVGLMKGDSIIALQDSCTFKIDSTFIQFTYREFPLAIQSNLVPDSLIIIVASGLGSGQVGTELIVDDFAFSTGSTSVSTQELLPGSFSLHQNYPNPFNASTALRFEVQNSGPVLLNVFDMLGREIASIVNERLTPGVYTRTWNAGNAASGIYYYRLHVGDFTQTKKLVLMK